MTQPCVLNRRQLIRAALGASAAPMLVPLLGAASRPEFGPMPQATSRTLVVVLHGLFAFLFGAKGDGISVVVPKVAGHVYWAGDFGHEDLNVMPAKKNLTLGGVKAGSWTPNFNFPYLDRTLKVATTSLQYTSLTLPWPDDLVLDRLVPSQPGKDFFSQPSDLKPTVFPTIYSFVYRDGSIASRPGLNGTNWKAPRSWGQSGGVNQAVLHVRAEHCGVVPMNNGWDTFNDLFGLTGNGRIVLSPDYQYGIPGPANGVSGVVAPDEDDFLIDEAGCKPSGEFARSAPINCAGLGGKKGP
jgi:hypothetical protein